MSMATPRRWDIFCTVVDNYGDIGVCWRLARQLVAEHDLRVRLWVDDLASFARIDPDIDPARQCQTRRGVEVRRWGADFGGADLAAGVADVVIEAFACELPQTYVLAMAQRPRQPLWINLEYLSAENWVRGCHGLPSPHPRLPLVKHFFFPGFFAGTGGLVAERGLTQRRRTFRSDAAAQAGLWRDLGVPAPAQGEVRVSLFSYDNPAIPAMLDGWARAIQPVCCLIPAGPAAAAASAWLGGGQESGAGGCRGALQVRVLPFVAQERYDELLWACDCNFVRGEDSFVRAQWAARPMVWHIYPQDENAHWRKLAAFLHIYLAGMAADAASAVDKLWLAWNRGEGAATDWQGFWNCRADLDAHAENWAQSMAGRRDLAFSLVEFCQDRLK
jgi:uncharacterized repeat protein (TIGR03837 family)